MGSPPSASNVPVAGPSTRGWIVFDGPGHGGIGSPPSAFIVGITMLCDSKLGLMNSVATTKRNSLQSFPIICLLLVDFIELSWYPEAAYEGQELGLNGESVAWDTEQKRSS